MGEKPRKIRVLVLEVLWDSLTFDGVLDNVMIGTKNYTGILHTVKHEFTYSLSSVRNCSGPYKPGLGQPDFRRKRLL